MPSSITTYHTFAAGTKARASQVNTNFSNYRGDILPINEDTASSSNSTHDLGKSDHRWRTVFADEVNFTTSTSTAGVIIKADQSATAGSFNLNIGASTTFNIRPTGIFHTLYGSNQISPRRLQRKLIVTTAGTTATIAMPSDCTNATVVLCSGGQGGDSGNGGTGVGTSGTGGSGGSSGEFQTAFINFTAAQTATYCIGIGGSGGAGTSSVNGANGKTGTASYLQINGLYIYSRSSYGFSGGAGGLAGNSGSSGIPSFYYGETAAAGGAGNTGGGGGGGGGGLFGAGGQGGAGSSGGNGGAGVNASTTSYGAGGGGGGGAPTTNTSGKGGNAADGFIMIYCNTAEDWEGTI